MTNVLLIVAAVVLFVIAVVSPQFAGKIQRKTNRKANWLKRLANWFWDPVTWWAQHTIEFTRKALVVIADWGKKTRRKLPF